MPPEKTPVRAPAKKTSGVVIPHAPTWYQRVAGWLIYGVIRTVTFTMKIRWTDRTGFPVDRRPGAIYCVWHNRLALGLLAYFDYVAGRSEAHGLAAMVSASKDGALLAAVLTSAGVKPVRGSSSRRGAQALRELVTVARDGYDLAITPDGPRGPRYSAQSGVIDLACLTGRPIVPVSWNADRKISLNSWDRFQIPLPFSRCELILEKPIRVPRDASPEERETFRRELETVLNRISRD